jgi:hypothetical protein
LTRQEGSRILLMKTCYPTYVKGVQRRSKSLMDMSMDM